MFDSAKSTDKPEHNPTIQNVSNGVWGPPLIAWEFFVSASKNHHALASATPGLVITNYWGCSTWDKEKL